MAAPKDSVRLNSRGTPQALRRLAAWSALDHPLSAAVPRRVPVHVAGGVSRQVSGIRAPRLRSVRVRRPRSLSLRRRIGHRRLRLDQAEPAFDQERHHAHRPRAGAQRSRRACRPSRRRRPARRPLHHQPQRDVAAGDASDCHGAAGAVARRRRVAARPARSAHTGHRVRHEPHADDAHVRLPNRVPK